MGVVIIGEVLLLSPLWSAINSGLCCQEMLRFDHAENTVLIERTSPLYFHAAVLEWKEFGPLQELLWAKIQQ